MRNLLLIIIIAALILPVLSQTTVQAQTEGFYLVFDSVTINGGVYYYTFTLVNNSGTEIIFDSYDATWTSNLRMYGLTVDGFRFGINGGTAASSYSVGYMSAYSSRFTLPAGGQKTIRLEWWGYTDTPPTNITLNTQSILNGTPTPSPTPTVYGEPTATVTPTPTATPRPDVESTAESMMMNAQAAVSDTLGIDEIAPYDWRASNPTLTFPNLFDDVIAPYIGPIIGYALALWEIVNTNNVVAIIFILALGIGLLIWVVKLIAGANKSGWSQTRVRRYRNPYRWR